MNTVIKRLLFLALLLVAPLLAAQESAEPPPMPPPGESERSGESAPAGEGEVPAPPPLPEKAEQPDMPPPTVTIRREEGKVVEEYSMGGSVYMVRVTPENAPPYMLLDTDGDGQLERTDSEVGPHVLPPHWVLFEWE